MAKGAARQGIDIRGFAMRRDGTPHLISEYAWLLRGQDENAHSRQRLAGSQATETREVRRLRRNNAKSKP